MFGQIPLDIVLGKSSHCTCNQHISWHIVFMSACQLMTCQMKRKNQHDMTQTIPTKFMGLHVRILEIFIFFSTDQRAYRIKMILPYQPYLNPYMFLCVNIHTLISLVLKNAKSVRIGPNFIKTLGQFSLTAAIFMVDNLLRWLIISAGAFGWHF